MSHVDPRLNCAAEICCIPPAALVDSAEKLFNQPAHAARVAILIDLGVEETRAHKVSRVMDEKGIVFLSAELATAIRNVVFPENGEGNGKAAI